MSTYGMWKTDPVGRFMSLVRKQDDGCWRWVGTRSGKPGRTYGKATRDGKGIPAHRLGYELFVGPIPEGLELDHLCRFTMCVNPAHLEPVTRRENVRRAFAARGQCPKGHPYTPENRAPNGVTRYGYPKTRCRPCDLERHRVAS